MLIETGLGVLEGSERPEGQGHREKLQVMVRRASRDMPLRDCTNTTSLRIDQVTGGSKLPTKGQWKRMARLLGKEDQQL